MGLYGNIWTPFTYFLLSTYQRVGRVLSFFSSRWNWDSPNPSPASECTPPPFGSGGRGTLAGERGGGRVPIPKRGHTLCSLYVCTLCCLLSLSFFFTHNYGIDFSSILVKWNINFPLQTISLFILKLCYLLQLSKRQLDSYGSPQAAPAVDTYGAPASQPCELKVSLYCFSVKCTVTVHVFFGSKFLAWTSHAPFLLDTERRM